MASAAVGRADAVVERWAFAASYRRAASSWGHRPPDSPPGQRSPGQRPPRSRPPASVPRAAVPRTAIGPSLAHVKDHRLGLSARPRLWRRARAQRTQGARARRRSSRGRRDAAGGPARLSTRTGPYSCPGERCPGGAAPGSRPPRCCPPRSSSPVLVNLPIRGTMTPGGVPRRARTHGEESLLPRLQQHRNFFFNPVQRAPTVAVRPVCLSVPGAGAAEFVAHARAHFELRSVRTQPLLRRQRTAVAVVAASASARCFGGPERKALPRWPWGSDSEKLRQLWRAARYRRGRLSARSWTVHVLRRHCVCASAQGRVAAAQCLWRRKVPLRMAWGSP